MGPEAFLPVAFVIGYLFGSIPFGLILTKLAGTQDLRSIGSGSIGATNVLRTGNKGLAAATLIGDMLKGTAAVVVAGMLWGPEAAMIAGLGAFLGHLFPVWLKFSGGKGIATYIGVLARPVLAGGGDVRRDLARHCLQHPLLFAVGTGRRFCHADFPLALRTPRARLAVCGADTAVVLGAPRKHQAVAGRHRRQDRAEVASAAAPARRSAPRRAPWRRRRVPAITCTPTGRLPSTTSAGTLTQGVPNNVQSRLKMGSPVESSPLGGAPGADVSSTSTSSNTGASAARAFAAIACASSYSAGDVAALVETTAQQRRHLVVVLAIFPGEGLMCLELLQRGMDAPGLGKDLRQRERRAHWRRRARWRARPAAAPRRWPAPLRRQNPASPRRCAASASMPAAAIPAAPSSRTSPHARSSTPAANSPTVSSVHEKHLTPTVGSSR